MGVHLLGRGDSERRTRIMAHVRASAERAQRLTEELLDFTQARVGNGLSVKLKALDLHELTDRTLDELRLSFPDCVIAHHRQGPGECVADADRLSQLIGNLVGNAVAYGDRSAPIAVSSSIENGNAKLTVHNEGDPIPAEKLADIFEPMVRGAVTHGALRSVGLGLFIVREIARSHGGEVEVNSSQAQGTEFILRFPAQAASGAALA